MIVDTPGVGDCEELYAMLKEYLPYAVAFVFVVDPTRGGGMQEDRVWIFCDMYENCGK
jgi:receptor-interacting serine/threonine-protein kinase 5